MGCASREAAVSWHWGPAGVKAKGAAVLGPPAFCLSSLRPCVPALRHFTDRAQLMVQRGQGCLSSPSFLEQTVVPRFPVPAQPEGRRGVDRELHLSPSPGPSPSLGAPGSSLPLTGPHFLDEEGLEMSTLFGVDSPLGHLLART